MNKLKQSYYPAALTIAGSDSSGGAGIQADLRTFAAFGVYGCSAVTAVTAQSQQQVFDIETMSARFVATQIKAVTDTIVVGAVKTGMLSNCEIIADVVDRLSALRVPVVVDPVMVSSSGTELLAADAIELLQTQLLPRADWLMPNIPEAEILSGRKIASERDMLTAAQLCAARWQCGVVLKAGHLSGHGNGACSDIVAVRDKLYRLTTPWLDDCLASHGTGCTLSAALTAALALGFHWKKALKMAKGFLYGSMLEAVQLSAKTAALYPPSESCLELVTLTRIKNMD